MRESTNQLSEALARVAKEQKRVIVRWRGRKMAAVIPVVDLRLLERLEEEAEDRLDLAESLKVMSDPNDEVIDWEVAKAELRGGKNPRTIHPKAHHKIGDPNRLLGPKAIRYLKSPEGRRFLKSLF